MADPGDARRAGAAPGSRRARSPGRPRQPAPPTPFQVSRRASRGDGSGARPPPCTPPPGPERGGGGGPGGLRARFASRFSPGGCGARSDTKEGTFSRLSASPRLASCNPGVPPAARPRGPPRPAAPKAPLAMCRLFWVPQQGGAGEREARPRPGGGGRGGAGWGGVEAPRTHPPAGRPGRRGEGRAVGVAFYLCERGGVSFPQGISTIALRARLLILGRSGSGAPFYGNKAT